MARAHLQRRRHRRQGLPYISPIQLKMFRMLESFIGAQPPTYELMARYLGITPYRAMRDFYALTRKGYLEIVFPGDEVAS